MDPPGGVVPNFAPDRNTPCGNVDLEDAKVVSDEIVGVGSDVLVQIGKAGTGADGVGAEDVGLWVCYRCPVVHLPL